MTKGTIPQGKQLYRALATQLTGSSNKFHVGGSNQVKTSELIIVSAEMYEETEISPLDWQQTQPTPGSVPLWFLTVPCRAWPLPPESHLHAQWSRSESVYQCVESGSVRHRRVQSGFSDSVAALTSLVSSYSQSTETSGFLSMPVCSYTWDMPTQDSQWIALPQSLLSGKTSSMFLVSSRGSSRYPQNMFSDLWGAREGPPCPGWRYVTHL